MANRVIASTSAALATSTFHERRLAAGALDRGHRAPAQLLVEVGHHDARALAGEQLRGGAAHPVARTRDERDLAVEPTHAPS